METVAPNPDPEPWWRVTLSNGDAYEVQASFQASAELKALGQHDDRAGEFDMSVGVRDVELLG